MSEAIAIIIGAVIALSASIVTTIMQNSLGKKKRAIQNYVEQFSSFYNLENLYIDEVSRLREIAKEDASNKKTIKEEFRRKNEEAGFEHITLTGNNASQFLKRI